MTKREITQCFKWVSGLNKYFSKEEIEMTNKYMKKKSTSLAIGEIKIKTTIEHYFKVTRMAIIKKMNKDKYWQGWEEIGTIMLMGMESGAAVLEKKKVFQFLKNT